MNDLMDLGQACLEENISDSIEVQETDWRSVMDALRLEVIGEGEDGRIDLYSKASRKKVTLKSLGQAKKGKLIQICGRQASEVIDIVGIDAIQSAVAEAAFHARRLFSESERRQGIWETENGSIAVVGADCFGKWDGKTFHQASSPIEGNVFYDTTSAVWKIDDNQLKQDLEQFDREKCVGIFRRLCEHLNHWIWVPDDLTRNAQIPELQEIKA